MAETKQKRQVKKPAKRRAKATSTAGKEQMVKQAISGVPVPSCMNLFDEASIFWESVTKTKSMWSEMDKINAVFLCNELATQCHEMKLLADEGYVIFDEATQTMRKNPRADEYNKRATRIIQLERLLQIHSHAVHGKSENQQLQNKKQMETMDLVAWIDSDLMGGTQDGKG